MAIQSHAYAPRVGRQRPHLVAVPDVPLASVHEITSAPSARRRRSLLREEEPSQARRPASPRTVAVATSVPAVVKVVAMIAGTALATAGAIGLGISLQPAAYDGPTAVHSVQAGESVWSLAATVATERPLREVVRDIEEINDINGRLLVGQELLIPLQ